MVIGVTGGSGSGKSYFSKLLMEQGAYLIDADLVARRVVEAGSPALLELARVFGNSVLLPDGTLNRKALGKLVFSNKAALAKLNAITHPHILREIALEISRNCGKIIVLDAALLTDPSFLALCDMIVFVQAPQAVREERIIKRDGLSRKAAQERIASQPSDESYIQISNHVVDGTQAKQALVKIARELLGR